jgi:hypothetical protein
MHETCIYSICRDHVTEDKGLDRFPLRLSPCSKRVILSTGMPDDFPVGNFPTELPMTFVPQQIYTQVSFMGHPQPTTVLYDMGYPMGRC